MKSLKIKLPTNENKFYEQVLSLFHFALNLAPQEQKVLAKLVKLNNEYITLPDDKRAKFIFSTSIRKEIKQELSLSEQNLNNIIHRLKKKTFFNSTILSEDNKINKALLFPYYSEGFTLEFEFYETSATPIPVNEPARTNPTTEERDLVNAPIVNTEEVWFRLKKYPEIEVRQSDTNINFWEDLDGNIWPKSVMEVIKPNNE